MKFEYDPHAYYTDNSDNYALLKPLDTPEKKLLRAILGRALLDIKDPSGARKAHDRREAMAWIIGKLKDPLGFSLRAICEALSDNADELQAKIIDFAFSTNTITRHYAKTRPGRKKNRNGRNNTLTI